MKYYPNIVLLKYHHFRTNLGKKYFSNVNPIKVILPKYRNFVGDFSFVKLIFVQYLRFLSNIWNVNPIFSQYFYYIETIYKEMSIFLKYWFYGLREDGRSSNNNFIVLFSSINYDKRETSILYVRRAYFQTEQKKFLHQIKVYLALTVKRLLFFFQFFGKRFSKLSF